MLSKNWYRLRGYLFAAALMLGIVSSVKDSNADDYLIIENPAALVIYYQYEQRLNSNAKTQLRSNSAWRILVRDQVLSDQFTHTLKVTFNQTVYYIQIDDKGYPVNQDNAGEIQKLQNVKSLGDTVQIKTSGKLSIDSGRDRFKLSHGMLLQRLFSYRGKTFVRQIGGQSSGWIVGKSSANWQIFHQEIDETLQEEKLFAQVDRIIERYNTRIEKLFIYLNNQHNLEFVAPQWVVRRSPAYLSYQFQPSDYQKQFNGSRSYLVQEVRDLLYGSAYQLNEQDSHITIRKTSR